MDLKKLLEKQKSIAVFGTGYAAGVFFLAMEEAGLAPRVSVFVETRPKPGKTFRGCPVVSVSEYEKNREDSLLCIAVHGSILSEVETELSRYGLEGIWIYPQLFDLLYGAPVEEKKIPVREILARQNPEHYWIAVRALAAETAGSSGGEVYLKALSLFSSPETSGRRLDYFHDLMENVRQNGLDDSQPVLLDEDGRIIDGLHRIALAALWEIPEISCRIYRRSPLYERILDERNFLTEEALRGAGLTEKERETLRRTQRKIFGNGPAVSVILPVYNVADYIDECMESLCAQTFEDFEALLIDDGSTDDSPGICDSWAEKDSRIRVIHKENGGVSSARNRGIEEAAGRYLAFADPDDWLDPDYLEELVRAAEDADADMAECDLWRVNGRTGAKIYRSCYGTMGIPWTREEHMIYGSTATYKAVTRRSLWIRNAVRLPDCAFESPAVYALVLALANRVVNVKKPMYYYRRFRPASLIETGYAHRDGRPNNTLGIEAMEHLTDEFRRLGLYEEYKETLERAVKYRLSDILAMQFHRKTIRDHRETAGNFRAFLERTFPESPNDRYLLVGGYNLNRILVHLKLLQDPDCRFNFSSIISIADEAPGGETIRHRNRYREIMLQREEDRSFWSILEQTRPSFLFIDLIEERFDILEREGRLITDSDARSGAEPDEGAAVKACRRIPRDSGECRQLFAGKSRAFIERVKAAVSDVRVVVVENYLSETAGSPEKQEPFPELESIRKTNAVLKQCYGALYEACPDAVRIVPGESGEEKDLLFTDRNYEYGAIPSHLNEIVNRKIAKRIGETLFGGTGG